MPVTFKVAEQEVAAIPAKSLATEKIIELAAREQYTKNFGELFQSSLSAETHPHVFPFSNGFVSTVIHAYSRHLNLIIRPDDVWMAILCQLQFYINANAEKLQSLFVEHQGTKELTVSTSGTRYTVDFGELAKQMSSQLHEHVKDKDLVRWAVPDFTTTTVHDTVVYSILLMTTLKSYFSFRMSTKCGIPQVTLAGEKSDWEDILSRLEKLSSFGEQPTAWIHLLRPILYRFIASFELPAGVVDPETVDFWSKVAHYHSHGSGMNFLSGWITTFCVWDEDGLWQGPNVDDVNKGGLEPMPNDLSFPGLFAAYDEEEEAGELPRLVLDGRPYPRIKSNGIPVGYAAVDVKLDDNGEVIPCEMISGHIGMHLEDVREGMAHEIRPASAWFIYAKKKKPGLTANEKNLQGLEDEDEDEILVERGKNF